MTRCFARSSVFAAILLGGCSVVYPVQHVPSSLLVADYQNDNYSFKVVDLTPSSAMEANKLWSYEPKPIPDELSVPSALPRASTYRATSLGSEDCDSEDCYLVAQVANNLDQSSGQDGFQFRNPPRSQPQAYRVGVGDVFTVTIERIADGASTAFQREAIVDYAGNIFITDVGEVNVLGQTVAEARQAVADRIRDSRLPINGAVTITGFNSQRAIVSIPGKTTSFLPITTTPITLREAYLNFTSGIDSDAKRQVVVMRRGEESFPIRGRDVLRQTYGYDVNLRDGDEIQIFDAGLEDVPAVSIAPDVLALNQARQEQRRFEVQEERARRDEARADAEARRANQRLRLAENEAERAARAEARADSAEQRASLNEARLDAAEARAARDEARRDAEAARAEREEARRQAEEARAEAEALRREKQFEFEEDRLKSQQFRDRLANRRDKREEIDILEKLGALRPDRIFVGGETKKQRAIAMPFGRHLTLAEAIYDSDGIEPVTGDPSKVYVVRVKSTVGESIESYIFRFDHSNLANTAAMTMFEMRPNDYVVVLPRAVSNFNRFISQILPSFSSVITAGAIAATN